MALNNQATGLLVGPHRAAPRRTGPGGREATEGGARGLLCLPPLAPRTSRRTSGACWTRWRTSSWRFSGNTGAGAGPAEQGLGRCPGQDRADPSLTPHLHSTEPGGGCQAGGGGCGVLTVRPPQGAGPVPHSSQEGEADGKHVGEPPHAPLWVWRPAPHSGPCLGEREKWAPGGQVQGGGHLKSGCRSLSRRKGPGLRCGEPCLRRVSQSQGSLPSAWTLGVGSDPAPPQQKGRPKLGSSKGLAGQLW